jgi:hypothetical protein
MVERFVKFNDDAHRKLKFGQVVRLHEDNSSNELLLVSPGNLLVFGVPLDVRCEKGALRVDSIALRFCEYKRSVSQLAADSAAFESGGNFGMGEVNFLPNNSVLGNRKLSIQVDLEALGLGVMDDFHEYSPCAKILLGLHYKPVYRTAFSLH